MKDLLIKYSNWKVILAVFLLLVTFSIFTFPPYQAKMADAAGGPVEPLDTRLSYSPGEVTAAFENLGAEGRIIYRTVVGRIDMIFPLLYGSLFILALASLLKKVVSPGSRLMWLALLPLIGMLFDYLENFKILRLLDTFPNLSVATVAFAERFTLLKHAFLFACVAMILILILFLILKQFLTGNTSPGSNSTRSI